MVGKNGNKLTGLSGLLVVLVLILSSSRCDDDRPFAYQLVTFILPMNIHPSDSVVFIGDTLWVTADIPDSLIEFNTNKKYRLSNFDFGQTSIIIRKLVDKNKSILDQPGAASSFNFIEDIGKIVFPGETFVDFKYHYDPGNRSYLLRIGLVAKNQGVFFLKLLSPSEINYNGVIDLGRDTNEAVITPVYEDLVFPINSGENNFELFKDNCLDPSEGTDENYRTNYRYTTFTFRVK